MGFFSWLFGSNEKENPFGIVGVKIEPEAQTEWMYMGDGTVELVKKQSIEDEYRVTRNISNTSSHTSTTQPYVYTDSSPSYDSGSSCDSGSFGGSCD